MTPASTLLFRQSGHLAGPSSQMCTDGETRFTLRSNKLERKQCVCYLSFDLDGHVERMFRTISGSQARTSPPRKTSKKRYARSIASCEASSPSAPLRNIQRAGLKAASRCGRTTASNRASSCESCTDRIFSLCFLLSVMSFVKYTFIRRHQLCSLKRNKSLEIWST